MRLRIGVYANNSLKLGTALPFPFPQSPTSPCLTPHSCLGQQYVHLAFHPPGGCLLSVRAPTWWFLLAIAIVPASTTVPNLLLDIWIHACMCAQMGGVWMHGMHGQVDRGIGCMHECMGGTGGYVTSKWVAGRSYECIGGFTSRSMHR